MCHVFTLTVVRAAAVFPCLSLATRMHCGIAWHTLAYTGWLWVNLPNKSIKGKKGIFFSENDPPYVLWVSDIYRYF